MSTLIELLQILGGVMVIFGIAIGFCILIDWIDD